MSKMLKIHFRGAFSSKGFKVSLIFGICISLSQVLTKTIPYLNNVAGEGSRFTPFTQWIGMNVFSSQAQILLLLLPLLACLPFADSYCLDINSGNIKNVFIRSKKENYFTSIIFVNFIVGGLVYIIPLLINLWILAILLPSILPNFMNGGSINDVSMWGNLYYSHPYIYFLLYIIIDFLYAGTFATIGLAVSMLTKKRFGAIIIPFLIYMMIFLVFQLVGIPQLAPTKFLSPGQEVNGIRLSYIIIEFLILFVGSLITFILGAYKRETY